MKDIQHFIIDWKDFYGRILPGGIVLVDLYFIIIGMDTHSAVRTTVQSLYESGLILFSVVFVFGSYVVGYISLSLIYYGFVRWVLRRSPSKLLKVKGDPTADQGIRELFENNFREEMLNKRASEVIEYCKVYLLSVNPSAFTKADVLDAGCGAKYGFFFAFFLTSIVLAWTDEWILLSMSVIACAVFAWESYRALEARDRVIMWLYFHTAKEQRPGTK